MMLENVGKLKHVAKIRAKAKSHSLFRPSQCPQNGGSQVSSRFGNSKSN
jgi:hypothetical protein